MDDVIKKRELMLLLNDAYKEGITEFTVEEPYFKTSMLKVDLDDDTVTLSPKDEFKKPETLSNYWDSSDIPGFDDYKDCLLSSGLIDYSNWSNFVEWVGFLHRNKTDPTLSSRSIYLAIDTNLAYLRLLSRRFPLRYDDKSIQLAEFDYIVSSIVEGEVDHRITAKYTEADLKMMGMYTDIGDIRYNFRNRGKLSTRKAKFANLELSYIRENLNSVRVKGTACKTDSEKNDIRIVESLESFAWSKDITPALISADRNMGNHAENAEIPYFILEFPERTSKIISVGTDTLLNLLHDLALTFGAVKIPEMETTLFGIWAGKMDSDYRNESVQAWVNANSIIERRVKRDLKVLRNF